MSAVQIQGNASGTGTLTIAAPNTNTNRTLTLPDGTGTFTVAGVNSNIVAGTINAGGTNPFPASAGPTTVDFTSIPSWVKRITVMFNSVSTSGTSNPLIQIGAGSVTSTGYSGQSAYLGATTAIASYTTGFGIFAGSAGNLIIGHAVITLVSGNIWVASINISASSSFLGLSSGTVSLGGTLDRVRITTVNGTDTFDAGSINILYE